MITTMRCSFSFHVFSPNKTGHSRANATTPKNKISLCLKQKIHQTLYYGFLSFNLNH